MRPGRGGGERKPSQGRSTTDFLLLVLMLWEQKLKIDHFGTLSTLSEDMQNILSALGRALCKQGVVYPLEKD